MEFAEIAEDEVEEEDSGENEELCAVVVCVVCVCEVLDDDPVLFHVNNIRSEI